MDFDYFSVDAILAENQKIQCTFKQEILGMGHLGGGSERNIAIQSKVQMPIWMAYTIIYSDWAEFNIPVPFGSRVRNALKAEPCSVRLSNLVGAGGLWYGFGKTIMDILSEEQAKEMSETLTKTFKGRLVEVVDQAQHFAALGQAGAGGSAGNSPQAFREGLDTTERELFSLAQQSAKRTKNWYEESGRANH
ncbi:GINS complex Psf3 component [Crepidotus variabilis]|uniref:DNA replication complex GINS protein PSF3 n=1 Tax=Crepidotus variabilis TaxID=179855 RepID=A0A9P6ET84_9AGAR|nr:GINS complex Psf3 component [Crepidotus variabilis]